MVAGAEVALPQMSSTMCRMCGAYHLTRSVRSRLNVKRLPSSVAATDSLSCNALTSHL